MARIFGELRPNATYGERALLQAFSSLPDSYTIWPELSIRDEHEHSSDFVLFSPDLGVCLLEAKDWIDILEGDPDRLTIRMRDGRERTERNPLKGAREKALALARRLERKPALIRRSGMNQGKLVVPWAYAVAFPNLTRLLTSWLDDVLGDHWVIFQDDLGAGQLEHRLKSLDWRRQAHLSDAQVDAVLDGIYPHRTKPLVHLTPEETDAVRSAVDPVLIVEGPKGAELGVLDPVQEGTAKDGLFEEAGEPIDLLTDEEATVAQRLVVRLVRGVAGSGKTRVLIARAQYLAKAHPDWRILVVTFNEPLARRLRQAFRGQEDHIRATHFHQVCQERLAACGVWSDPLTDREGRLAYLLNSRLSDLKDHFDARFLDAEIGWLKDTGCIDLERYLAVPRLGRARRLLREEREQVWRVFQAYQQNLQYRRLLDWEDVPLVTLAYLVDGRLPGDQYDAILIDEAQDFAPVWFEVLKKFLNPHTGVIFLAADATQRIYRRFTWRSLGLEVVGRSRVLSKSYRNTYEILRTAFELIRHDELLLKQLGDEEEELAPPDLDPAGMRHGPYPELRRFDGIPAERLFLIEWVRAQIAAGTPPGEVAVFHRKRTGVEKYLAALRSAGIPAINLKEEGEGTPDDSVIVSTIHLAKGLEYRAVYLGQLQELFKPDKYLPAGEYAHFRADELRLLYVGLSRAREQVCLTYEGALPADLAHLDEFLRAASGEECSPSGD